MGEIVNFYLKNFGEKYKIKIFSQEELLEQERAKRERERETLKKEIIISRFERAGLSCELLNKIESVTDFKKVDISKNAFITGSFGVGKTWGVLKSVLNHMQGLDIERFHGFSFIYVRFADIFDLKYQDHKAFMALKKTPLLIIDEFLTLGSYNRADLDLTIHDIIDKRLLDSSPTILISNLKEGKLEGLLEGSILSRLKEFKKVSFEGLDKRGEKK